ncbi:unnamed protein product [Ixodes persulcatus]
MPCKCCLWFTSLGLQCASSRRVAKCMHVAGLLSATSPMAFFEKGPCLAHTRTHAADGPFKCQEVCKSFAHKSTLSGTFECTCEALREPTVLYNTDLQLKVHGQKALAGPVI